MLSGLLCEIVSRIWGSHGALGVPKGGSLGGACGAVGVSGVALENLSVV